MKQNYFAPYSMPPESVVESCLSMPWVRAAIPCWVHLLHPQILWHQLLVALPYNLFTMKGHFVVPWPCLPHLAPPHCYFSDAHSFVKPHPRQHSILLATMISHCTWLLPTQLTIMPLSSSSPDTAPVPLQRGCCLLPILLCLQWLSTIFWITLSMP